MFLCQTNSQQCIDAKDRFSLKISNTRNTWDFIEIYRNGSQYGRYLDRQWIKDTVEFNCTFDSIYVSLKC